MSKNIKNNKESTAPKKSFGIKGLSFSLSTILIVLALIGSATIAVIITQTQTKKNEFKAGIVQCQVLEEIDTTGTIKQSIKAQNTGDTKAYVRIRLATHYANAEGLPVGSISASIEEFDLASDWFAKTVGEHTYYYFKNPLSPGEISEELLGNGEYLTMHISDSYTQVIEVICEAIQCEPKTAVEEAWGVEVYTDKTLKA